MSRSSRRGHRKVAAVALAVSAGLFVSSCADSGNGGGSGDAPDSGSGLSIGPVNEQSGEGDPVKGGTLTFSGYSAVTNLDPAKTQIAGSVAGFGVGRDLRHAPCGTTRRPRSSFRSSQSRWSRVPTSRRGPSNCVTV